MADPFSVLATTTAILSLLKAIATTSSSYYNLKAGREFELWNQTLMKLRMSQQRLDALNTIWTFDRKDEREGSSNQVLWNNESAGKIQEQLHAIEEQVKDVCERVEKVEECAKDRNEAKRISFRRSRSQKRLDQEASELKGPVERLSENIDLLQAYYQTASETENRISRQLEKSAKRHKIGYPIHRGQTLQSPFMQGRAASLALHKLCSVNHRVYGLDLDLFTHLTSRSHSHSLSHSLSNPLSHSHSKRPDGFQKGLIPLSYHLYTRESHTHEPVMDIVITNDLSIPEPVSPQSPRSQESSPQYAKFFREGPLPQQKAGVPSSGNQSGRTRSKVNFELSHHEVNPESDAKSVDDETDYILIELSKDGVTPDQLLKTTKGGIIKVPQKGFEARFSFDVVKAATPVAASIEKLESLTAVLKRRASFDPSEEKERMSMTERVDLAFQIVECGLYLLGTPWLSCLKSSSIQRILDKKGNARYILDFSESSYQTMLSEEAVDVAESSHLIKIGILLIEIGLQQPATSLFLDDETKRLEALPKVERAMGSEYYKATAFCLQTRSTPVRFRGTDKFDFADNEEWRNYATDLVKEYRSHVFARLSTLNSYH